MELTAEGLTCLGHIVLETASCFETDTIRYLQRGHSKSAVILPSFIVVNLSNKRPYGEGAVCHST